MPPAPPRSEMSKSLRELRTTGFRKLREGRIHLRCYVCGRKVSNSTRMPHDPPHAVLMEVPCECSQGDKGCDVFYFDANGDELRAAEGNE